MISSDCIELCVSGDIAILPWKEPKIKWPYLRLQTTYALDFWYSNRYCQHPLPGTIQWHELPDRYKYISVGKRNVWGIEAWPTRTGWGVWGGDYNVQVITRFSVGQFSGLLSSNLQLDEDLKQISASPVGQSLTKKCFRNLEEIWKIFKIF